MTRVMHALKNFVLPVTIGTLTALALFSFAFGRVFSGWEAEVEASKKFREITAPGIFVRQDTYAIHQAQILIALCNIERALDRDCTFPPVL